VFGSAEPDVAVLFPRIISFMQTHTRNGKDISVLPEPPSLYVFAGLQAPSTWYSLLPGYLEPLREEEFIRDIISNDVRYVLISNRSVSEYGVRPFGIGYDQPIYEWLMENYEKVGQFGPVAGENRDHPYVMSIFVRKSGEFTIIHPRLELNTLSGYCHGTRTAAAFARHADARTRGGSSGGHCGRGR
jgi:hypothetical protein